MTEHETSKKSSDYLITGATGNIGGRVVEHVLQAGIRWTSTGRSAPARGTPRVNTPSARAGSPPPSFARRAS